MIHWQASIPDMLRIQHIPDKVQVNSSSKLLHPHIPIEQLTVSLGLVGIIPLQYMEEA